MKRFGVCFGAGSVVTAGLLLMADRPAVADTYGVYELTLDNGRLPVGIYTDGSALVWDLGCREVDQNPCYRSYDHGSQTAVSAAMPDAVFDNGSLCTISILGFAEAARCNGNYEAFTVNPFDPASASMAPGMYVGSIDDPTLVVRYAEATMAHVYLNSKGDVAFDDVESEGIFQAYNTTPAPEPGTMVLVLSGMGVGLVGARRVCGVGVGGSASSAAGVTGRQVPPLRSG